VKLTRSVQFHPALFHVLPIINVLFLVLALFALSSRFVLQPGISVALPLSSFTLGPQQNPEIVSITAAPVPTIYFRDHQVSVEELAEQLTSGSIKQRSLILKADRNTPYDLVMRITNLGLRQGFSVVLATAPIAQ
jgi:biopolymer transport protein ExbD